MRVVKWGRWGERGTVFILICTYSGLTIPIIYFHSQVRPLALMLKSYQLQYTILESVTKTIYLAIPRTEKPGKFTTRILVGRSQFSILYKSILSTVATKSSLSSPHRRSQRTQNAHVSSNPGKTPRRSIHLYSTL